MNGYLVPFAGIVDEIQHHHDLAGQKAQEAMQHALEAGRLLTEVKTALPHGQFTDWVSANTRIAPRTARAYMQLAHRIPELDEAKRQRVATLPLRKAIRMIADGNTQRQRPSWSPEVGRVRVQMKPATGMVRESDESQMYRIMIAHRTDGWYDYYINYGGMYYFNQGPHSEQMMHYTLDDVVPRNALQWPKWPEDDDWDIKLWDSCHLRFLTGNRMSSIEGFKLPYPTEAEVDAAMERLPEYPSEPAPWIEVAS